VTQVWLVTEVIKASRWVLDYRPSPDPRTRPIPAVYVVVTEQGILGPAFRFEHFGGHAVKRSEAPEAEHILFLRYRRESIRFLGPWAIPSLVYIEPVVPLSLTCG
jgi:hypothetical protein